MRRIRHNQRGLRRRFGKRRHGHVQPAGTMHALRNMEIARRAYRAARAAGRSVRSAHQAAFNALRHIVGAGAWDLATQAQREAGE